MIDLSKTLIRWLRHFLTNIIVYITVRLLVLTIALSLFIGTGVVILDVLRFIQTPIAVKDAQTINIVAGMNIDQLSKELQQRHIITHPLYFRLLARMTGTAQRLQVGEFALKDDMRPQDLLNLLSSGQSIQYAFTIIEGWHFKQLRQALAQNTNLKQTLTSLSDAEIMQQLGLGNLHPEGRFLPDTYFFPKGYSDAQLLKRSFNAMNTVLEQAWQQRDAALPFKTPEELLILASLIEKETGVASERSTIAGVFVRRLANKMRLQTDPTVIYGVGDAYRGVITRAHLTQDTPYNTYTRAGLPPTPIAMPGRAALMAAANPQSGTSLYFVAKGDGSGEHIFSDTLEEHNRAVQRYRQRLQQ